MQFLIAGIKDLCFTINSFLVLLQALILSSESELDPEYAQCNMNIVV